MPTTLSTTPKAQALTWDDYLTEEAVNKRYDIVDGLRRFWSPTFRHQRFVGNLRMILGEYERRSGAGFLMVAPFDILIQKAPRLQTRQPDAMLLCPATFAAMNEHPTQGFLTLPPKLTIEIISNEESAQRLSDKLADYCTIGVSEAWVVRPDVQTVEVLDLASGNPVSVAVYNAGQNVQSLTFPDLTPAVADFFLP